jgi:hypothetical protein
VSTSQRFAQRGQKQLWIAARGFEIMGPALSVRAFFANPNSRRLVAYFDARVAGVGRPTGFVSFLKWTKGAAAITHAESPNC